MRVLGLVMVSLAFAPAPLAAEQPRATPPINIVAPRAPGDKLEPDDLPAPQLEVADHAAIELPAIPDFRLPVAAPGFHAPRELVVHGAAVLGTEIKVKGYVTWIYDCRAALAAGNPGATHAQLAQAIDDDPALCEYPKLYLGDARDTPRGASIWVVDLPRPPSRAERMMLSRDQRKAWPAAPRVAVGDRVVVTGTWALRSGHAEHNTSGLLVYHALSIEAAPDADGADARPRPSPGGAAPTAIPSERAVVAPLRAVVDPTLRDISINHLNACNKANAARRYDAALAACQAATRAWDGNHLAWYATAGAYIAKGQWRDAAAAAEHAVTRRPDQAMYQLYLGMACYEAEHQRARDDQARRTHQRPDDVAIDPSVLRLGPAREALLHAVRLAPALWRAHYYLGRLHRDLDEPRLAAEQLTLAIKANPGHRNAYVALVELYRRWGYLDQLLAVAVLGTRWVAAADAGDLWLEAAMAYDANADDARAIEALGNAIASKPGDGYARLQRGRLYFRTGDLVNARRDLEGVVASQDPRLETAKQLAAQLLARLAGGSSRAPGQTSCNGTNVCHIMAAPNSTWAGVDPITRM